MSRTALMQEDYLTLRSHLEPYRLDPYIQKLEASKGRNKGLIFPFARGLRFSALLIYKIRQMLSSSTHVTASWGQILLDDEGTLSNECDIIIHKTGYAKRWNGEGGEFGHIMDFKFVELSSVLAVISCKSYIKTNTVEVDYFQSLNQHISKVWLFAECCNKSSVKTIREKAVQHIGYEYFWHLYGFNKKTGERNDAFNDWKDFNQKVKELVQNI